MIKSKIKRKITEEHEVMNIDNENDGTMDTKVINTDNVEVIENGENANITEDESVVDDEVAVTDDESIVDINMVGTDDIINMPKDNELENIDNVDELPAEFTKDLDFKDLCPPKIDIQSMEIPLKPSAVTVINSMKNGKRIMPSKDLMARLNYPKSLQFAFKNNNLVIGEKLSENKGSFYIRKMSERPVVYSSALVQVITEELGLDFSDRVSITLSDVTYKSSDGYIVAIIKGNK